MSEIKKADLHSHTTASDGTFTASESVARAVAKGLSALAITDHDTVGAIPEAMEAGLKYGLEIVPGVEISSVYNGLDIHVLGYFMDCSYPPFLQKLEELKNVRQIRNQMMLAKLNDLGISITIEEVEAPKKEKGNTGRPHIAAVLVKKGVVKSIEEAFEKYLGRSGLAYCNPPRISPEEAIDLIHEAKGVSVLAHPGLYGDLELIKRLIRYGLKGIEVYHPDHGIEEERLFSRIADENHLIKTAGSDFHGIRDGQVFHGDLGDKYADFQIVEQIRKAHFSS